MHVFTHTFLFANSKPDQLQNIQDCPEQNSATGVA